MVFVLNETKFHTQLYVQWQKWKAQHVLTLCWGYSERNLRTAMHRHQWTTQQERRPVSLWWCECLLLALQAASWTQFVPMSCTERPLCPENVTKNKHTNNVTPYVPGKKTHICSFFRGYPIRFMNVDNFKYRSTFGTKLTQVHISHDSTINASKLRKKSQDIRAQ